MFVNCLLNEFVICFAVVAVLVLNVIVVLYVSVFFVVGETMYCLSEYAWVVSDSNVGLCGGPCL